MKKLEVKIESKSFPENLLVLENFEFKIRSGEFVAIVGPSGAGKTTLLNIIAELDHDYQGSVRIISDGNKQDDIPNIGFMFQQARLIPWLTVSENITLVLGQGSNSTGKPSQRLHKKNKVQKMIDQVGLSGFENSYPHQLSGGMQKRVALARAFVIEPRLLLLDEPFQSLDSPTANRFRQQLMSMWDRQRQTVLFVTHDLREAISLADRILFLSNRPARILLDYKVNLARPRSIDSEAVSLLHQAIQSLYPEILSGQIA